MATTLDQFNSQTGNLINISVGGATIGYIQALNPDISLGAQYVYKVGDPNPQEIVYGTASYSLGCNGVMVRQSSPQSAGIFPKTNDDLIAFLRNGTKFDVTVSSTDGTPICAYRGCKATNFSNNYTVGGLVMFNMSMLATSHEGTLLY